MEKNNFSKLPEEELVKLTVGKNAVLAAQAKHELTRRQKRRGFLIGFFFPNIWAILAFLISAYVAYAKSQS